MDSQNNEHNQSSVNEAELSQYQINDSNINQVIIKNKTESAKRVFFQILLFSVLASAGVAVIAVLIGSFGGTLARALGTVALVVLHSILVFSYVSASEKQQLSKVRHNTEVFAATVFGLTVVSFVTSVFAIWQIIDGTLALKLFLVYGVLLFATLHAEVLYRLSRYDKNLDTTIKINYFFMASVVVLLLITIFSIDSYELGDFFFRLLAATTIIYASMTVAVAIMYKLYLQKHPEIAATFDQQNNVKRNDWKNPFVVIFLIFLAIQVVGGIFSLIFTLVSK